MENFKIKRSQINYFLFRMVPNLIILLLMLNILIGCSVISEPHSAMLGHWQSEDADYDVFIGPAVTWRVDSNGDKIKNKYRIENMNEEDFTFTLINIINGEEFASKVEFSNDRKIMYLTRVSRIDNEMVSGNITVRYVFIRVDDKTTPD
jgi:hypothetical protein